MNNLIKKIIVIVIIIITLVLCIVGGKFYFHSFQLQQKTNDLKNQAKSCYNENIIQSLQNDIRIATGWDDLIIEIEYENYHSSENTYYILSKITSFKTDEIIKYADGKNSNELKNKITAFRNILSEYDSENKMDYDYTSEEGKTVSFSMVNYEHYDIFSTDNSVIFDCSFYNDSIYVKCDGEYLVSESSTSLDDVYNTDYTSLSYSLVTDDSELGEVWAMAQSFVKDKLKSPRSANFPTYSDNNVTISKARNYYKVSGYVDADNSFGANVRTVFSLVMEKNGKTYTLKECNLY